MKLEIIDEDEKEMIRWALVSKKYYLADKIKEDYSNSKKWKKGTLENYLCLDSARNNKRYRKIMIELLKRLKNLK